MLRYSRGTTVLATLALLSACGSGATASRGARAPTATGAPPAAAASSAPATPAPATPAPATPAPSPPPLSPTAAARPATGAPPHLLVIVLENTEYGSVIGNSSAPYLNGLARRYALATHYYASAHPSLPNYLELVAGSTFGLDGSDCPTCVVHGAMLTDELGARGIGWTAYMEGLPSPCFNGPAGAGAHPYARKHDPFVYFPQNLSGPCHVVPLSRMAADLSSGQASPFLWISPNLCDDGHDLGCGLPAADAWTARTLPGIMASTWYRQGGAVLIVWDEGSTSLGCCAGAYGGHIAAVVIADRLAPGARFGAALDHAGVLRGIEELYGVGLLRGSANPANGDLLALLRG